MRQLKSVVATSRHDRGVSAAAEYRRAIIATNKTGLASLDQYRLAFGPLARETRSSLCAQTLLFAALRHGASVSGVMTVGTYPPSALLPKALRQELAEVEDVVTATGTQVLEMRDSSEPLASLYTLRGRQDCAVFYLALGDSKGSLIRSLVWERQGAAWRPTESVRALAASTGLSRAQYETFRKPLSNWLPPADSSDILAVAHSKQAASGGNSNSSGPWISYAALTELVKQKNDRIPRSNPVNDGHWDDE